MKLRKNFFALSLVVFVSSCDKDNVELKPLSSLTVTNAIIGASALKVGSYLNAVGSNEWGQFSLLAGDNNLYIWPEGDSLHPVFNSLMQAKDNHIYSLFLTGELDGTIEHVLVDEDLPRHTDSTFAIRFIHLAPSTPPISVTLAGEIEHQFSDIEYKERTYFKTYSAKAGESYTFEIFDNNTGEILNSVSVTPPRFKNITLGITGMTKGEPAINITQVNHY